MICRGFACMHGPGADGCAIAGGMSRVRLLCGRVHELNL